MKQRKGFVSNSSSSSFILVFPQRPESSNDVYEHLFNGVEGEESLSHDKDSKLTHTQISDIVFKDISQSGVCTRDKLIEEFRGLVSLDLMDIDRVLDDNSNFIHFLLDHRDIGDHLDEIIKCEKESKRLSGELSKQLDDLSRSSGIDRNQLDTHKKTKNLCEKIYKEYRDASQPLWEQKEKIYHNVAEQKADDFIRDHRGWFCTIVEYEDHSPAGSIMEHADVFRHIEYVRISHH
jgi:hypothetical protein